jgi:predicted O-methyltransferase YrrM
VVSELDGWISPPVSELLYFLARRCGRRGNIVEIGSWQGKSTICLAMGLQKSGSPHRLVAIDPHSGSREHQGELPVDTYSRFVKNLHAFNVDSRVEVRRLTSRQAAEQPPADIAMVWIDGSHEYEDVLFDFSFWFDRLKDGGTVAFHDSNWPGVRRVLWEEVFLHRRVGIVRRIEQTTFAVKLARPCRACLLWNRLNLYREKARQVIKRRQRRRRRHRQKRPSPAGQAGRNAAVPPGATI